MISATDFRNNSVFEDGGELFMVLKYQHHKMAAEEAVVRVKLKNMRTGSIVERTYRPSARFRDVTMERHKKQYLYADGDMCHFMDMTTYETITFPKERLGESFHFLTDNLEVDALYLDEQFFAVELPTTVDLKVESTVPGIKGDSVSNMMKPATLETGVEVQVPLFVKEGDIVRVDTRDGEYVERV